MAVILSLSACRDTMNFDQIRSDSKLVVYAFPTAGTSFDILVSSSKPVNGVFREVRNIKDELHKKWLCKHDNTVQRRRNAISQFPKAT